MNMNKLVSIIVIGFIIISTVINLYFICNLDRIVNERLEVLNLEPEIIFLDSIEYDTVFVESKEIIKLPIYNTDTIKQTDTIIHQDSIFVEIPISVKYYKDTLAETVISFDLRGYNCEVNNLYVKNFLDVPTQENKPKRWYNNFGLGIGLGVTYIDRFRICPNVGIYYKLM